MATAAAKRYARAVFELAQQEGDLEQWARRLARIRELFEDPKVAAVLTNPTIPAARRDALVATAPHLFDAEATNLAVCCKVVQRRNNWLQELHHNRSRNIRSESQGNDRECL